MEDGKAVTTVKLEDVQRITIARFMDMAGEDVPPDFDRFGPDDFAVLIHYRDGSNKTFPAGKTIQYGF